MYLHLYGWVWLHNFLLECNRTSQIIIIIMTNIISTFIDGLYLLNSSRIVRTDSLNYLFQIIFLQVVLLLHVRVFIIGCLKFKSNFSFKNYFFNFI
jgi:hypothetical protein